MVRGSGFQHRNLYTDCKSGKVSKNTSAKELNVPRYDRYMLSQFIMVFSFFAFVLLSIFWINQAVRLFNHLVGDGQPISVYFEFTLLGLPKVVGTILPIAVLASTIYVTNRMSTESELAVIQSNGYSPWRMFVPVAIFGAIISIMMSLLTHFLIPNSLYHLHQRQHEIGKNISARLLSDGRFLHPADGVTFFIRQIEPDGELIDVFLSDRRNPDNLVTYSSKSAYLVNEEDSVQLVMLGGLAQNLNTADNRLFTTRSSEFSYDITYLLEDEAINLNQVEHANTLDMLWDPQAIADWSGASLAKVKHETHDRFAQAFLCITVAFIGFSCLLVGTYSRFGVWRQIAMAIFLVVVVKLMEGYANGMALSHSTAWPLLYVPAIAGVMLAVLQMHFASHPASLRILRTVGLNIRRTGDDPA